MVPNAAGYPLNRLVGTNSYVDWMNVIVVSRL
jgi:hypothetical protein